MSVIQIVLLYILSVNLGGFIAYGIDKKRSIRSKWRIPEATLITFALVGGSVGCLLGMKVFRHKTKKTRFVVGFPSILITEIICVIIYLIIK